MTDQPPSDLAKRIAETVPENWKPILRFDGAYEVSDQGRVHSLIERNRHGDEWPREEPRLLKATPNMSGYLRVGSRVRGHKWQAFVHTLVLKAFVGSRPDGLVAAHLDGDKLNNRVENLAWVTYQENSDHMRQHGTILRGEDNPHADLTNTQVSSMRALLRLGARQAGLARLCGVTENTISLIALGKTWRCAPRLHRLATEKGE